MEPVWRSYGDPAQLPVQPEAFGHPGHGPGDRLVRGTRERADRETTASVYLPLARGTRRPRLRAGRRSALYATGRVATVGIACAWHRGHGTAAAVDPHLKAAFAVAD